MEWQPIGTAPKDGQMILLYGNELSVGHWSRNAWRGLRVSFDYESGEPLHFTNNDEPLFAPTHWMPLPESPTHSKEAR